MFLLVLAHPGCPRQNPESCKMVVCVCVLGVCVCAPFVFQGHDAPTEPVILKHFMLLLSF